jgi:peptidoglycan/LPS O-acetylase OafA/YrhL
MPLLFLPLWRRLGGVLLVVCATAFAFAPYVITIAIHDAPAFSRPAQFMHDFQHVGDHPEWRSIHFMQPWFIALFAIGMAGAALQFPRHVPARLRRLEEAFLNVAVHPVGIALIVAGIVVCRHQRVPLDFFVGAATICLILHCTRDTFLGRVARRVLESRAAIFLGAISYSLYLFHGPLLVLLYRGLEPLNLGAGARLVAFTSIGLPSVVMAGWGAYWVFERPFLARGT